MKAASTEIDVAYVANLARLDLSADETAVFREQLGDVLEYMAKLKEVSISGAENEVARPANDLRADQARDWFTAEQALANAPRQRDGLFIVPKVIE
jgi:aspartyl-tRNA(Asn)/glutamyl-tRNA(Gln) amidotransferase subunit C